MKFALIALSHQANLLCNYCPAPDRFNVVQYYFVRWPAAARKAAQAVR